MKHHSGSSLLRPNNADGADLSSPDVKEEELLCYSRISHIPIDARIRVVHVDSSIVVIVKPNNIRSVPGFASSAQKNIRQSRPDDGPSCSRIEKAVNDDSESDNDKPPTQRRTAQEAWVLALRSFDSAVGETTPDSESGHHRNDSDKKAMLILQKLASQPASHVQCVPRKYDSFCRYLRKNARKLQLNRLDTDLMEGDGTFRTIFDRLRNKQLKLINLPEMTRPEESAFGQLTLLLEGEGQLEDSRLQTPTTTKTTTTTTLHVVHRLDCETSGLMVFARTKSAAQSLSRAWRERQVTKVYQALVHEWPPLVQALNGDRDTSKQSSRSPTMGRIDLPLRASSTERIKWQVDELHGKPSTTLWTVLQTITKNTSIDPAKGTATTPVRLELVPITGRTHQLRVHCAVVGGGIIGDSLYGRSALTSLVLASTPPGIPSMPTTLKLHAQKLCFSHPLDGRQMEFSVDPPW